jgi:hypothetical protein
VADASILLLAFALPTQFWAALAGFTVLVKWSKPEAPSSPVLLPGPDDATPAMKSIDA